ncbi:MAG: hypothetical protein ACYSU0_07180, partial [Planctomycetota bacterium]
MVNANTCRARRGIEPRAVGPGAVVRALAVLAAVAGGARAAATDVPLVRARDASEEDVEKTKHPEPARTKGWSWKLPPDVVRPSSPKRNNVFYVGEKVTFRLGGASASYEVRDYLGALVDRGQAGETVVLDVRRPGWYKVYVFGRETRPQW